MTKRVSCGLAVGGKKEQSKNSHLKKRKRERKKHKTVYSSRGGLVTRDDLKTFVQVTMGYRCAHTCCHTLYIWNCFLFFFSPAIPVPVYAWINGSTRSMIQVFYCVSLVCVCILLLCVPCFYNPNCTKHHLCMCVHSVTFYFYSSSHNFIVNMEQKCTYYLTDTNI